ncbi:RNA polymerase sigma factor [Paenibacillus macerans]|uniref:RNA polymerase sigma factor n=1 Tax=Paenibacillus macerans TaxID=44252 RepID=UPI003D3167CA
MESENSKRLLLLSPNFYALNASLQEEVFKLYYQLNYSSIMYMVKDHGAAEDIIQETFLKVLSKSPDIEDEKQFIAWMKVLVRNATINYLRKVKKFRNEVDVESVFFKEEPSADLESIENQIEVMLLEESIMNDLKDLKFEYRLLIELKWKKQLSYKEIALVLNCSENTIKQKLHRARAALKKKMNLKWGILDEKGRT